MNDENLKINDATTNLIQAFSQSIAEKDLDKMESDYEKIDNIDNIDQRIGALNILLITPGHPFHQEITRSLQTYAHPSSVAFIEEVLESNFVYLSYTSSDPKAIAKWFGWALASIGTPDAIALIKRFSRSKNPDIAEEMAYRLGRI